MRMTTAQRLIRSRISNPWAVFALRRFVGLLIVGAILVIATFLIVHAIPGDPARRAAGMDASPEHVESVRIALGLEEPIHVQFWDYVSSLARFDMGTSFVTNEPVSSIIANRLPNTVRLAGTAFVLMFAISVPLGISVGALTRNGRRPKLDALYSGFAGVGSALPEFLAGTFLVLIFGLWLGVLPVAGASGVESVVLPALAVSLRPAAILSRFVRTETLNVLSQDYIRNARAKRLPWRRIYIRHTLPNVMTASLTLGGVIAAGLLGGTVIVENVFAWPGLGSSVVQAVLARDYPLVQGVLLVLGLGVVVVNTAVDVVVSLTNPRSLLKAS